MAAASSLRFCRSALICRDELERGGGIENADIAIGAQIEQVTVTGDDQIGGGLDVIGDEFAWAFADQAEPFGGRGACEHVGEFGEQRGAAVELQSVTLADDLQELIRRAAPQQRRDQHVGIQNDPHSVS